jgi:hypothetical protein
MLHLLFQHSPLIVAGELALGLSLTMLLRGLIIAFDQRVEAK